MPEPGLARHGKRRSAFEIAEEIGVIGIDGDRRADTARNHSKHLMAALRGKRAA